MTHNECIERHGLVEQIGELNLQLAESKRRETELQAGRRHTQEWYARHYGKLEVWARTHLPEPWVTEFFNCVANGTHDVRSSDYFRVDTAEGQLIMDQTRRAEDAENRVKTLEDEQNYAFIKLTADFDRRTDILNNHIAREKVLEKQVSELQVSKAGILVDLHRANQRISVSGAERNQLRSRIKTLEDVIRQTRYWQDHAKIKEILEQALATREPNGLT